MFKNYLKVAIRNLVRYKVYSFLNISGLSIGLASFTIIMMFVQYELSYDRHFRYSEEIYRINTNLNTTGGSVITAQSPPGWATHLFEDYAEIVNVVRFKPPNQWWKVVYEDKIFYESNWTFADSTVIKMFDVKLKTGDPEHVLSEPYSVIISERMARKYFRDEKSVGKIFRLDNQYDFIVSGVFEEFPSNTHFEFDFLASFITLRDPIYGQNLLEIDNFPLIYTYIQFPAAYAPNQFEPKLAELIGKYVGDPEELAAAGFEMKANLQPITDIHLRSHLQNEIRANGSIGTIYIFFSIAFFILVIAGINFMNLSTARSTRRALEVGLRKVSGATKNQIISQFLGESILIALISMLLSIILITISIPVFFGLVGKDIDTSLLTEPGIMGLLFAVTVLIGSVSGLYPAFFISSFKPSDIFKGKAVTGRGGSGFLQKVLIILQFAISLGLIISTGILYKQMKFIGDLDLGLNEEQVVVVEFSDPVLRTLYRSFKIQVNQIASVANVSGSLNAPAGVVNQTGLRPLEAATDEMWIVQFFGIDFDFFETLGVEFVSGRDLSVENAADTLGAAILNETAVRDFGWESSDYAIGKKLVFGNNQENPPLTVIGVVSDFHMQSVHERITPVVMIYMNEQAYFYSFIRVTSDVGSSLKEIEAVWNNTMPNYPFQYSFLDENFEDLYRSEKTLGQLMTYFALLAIVVACFGLYGLTSYMVEQRTKEIGIRKVLGASVGKLLIMLANEYTLLIFLAFLIAGPIAYQLMNMWLQTFEYHIRIPLFIFWVSLGFVVVTAFLTVSLQSLKAATTNPVNSLRSV